MEPRCKSQNLARELDNCVQDRFPIRADPKDRLIAAINCPVARLEMMGIVWRQRVDFTRSVGSELVGHPEAARRELHRRGGTKDLNRAARLLLLTGVDPALNQVVGVNREMGVS